MCECEELGLEANTKAVLELELEDVGHYNADLYIANQEDNNNTVASPLPPMPASLLVLGA